MNSLELVVVLVAVVVHDGKNEVGVSNEAFLVLLGKVLEGEALGLGEEEGREDTSQHEEGEDLENVLEESVLAANVDETREADLGNNGTELARGSRDTMAGRPVSGGEDLAGNDEGSGVGPEVLEEVGHTVEEDKGFLGVGSTVGDHLVVTEAHGAENDGQDSETHELDGLSAPKSQRGRR